MIERFCLENQSELETFLYFVRLNTKHPPGAHLQIHKVGIELTVHGLQIRVGL